MNSVQENKNELEAAVRYCESAISRAKATIESMEFRQQAASKSWHEQTGREAALERDVKRLAEEVATLNDLKLKYDEANTNMALMTDELEALRERNDELKIQLVEWRDRSMVYTKEIGELKSELEELSKAYKDSTQEEITMKKAYRELKEVNNLQKDQIEMFQRKVSRMNEVDR